MIFVIIIGIIAIAYVMSRPKVMYIGRMPDLPEPEPEIPDAEKPPRQARQVGW